VKPKAPLKPRAPAALVSLPLPAPAAAAPPAAASAPAPAPAPAASVASFAPASPRAGAECKTVREILPPWQVLQDKFQPKAPSAPRNEALNQDAQQALEAQERANAMWAPPAAPAKSDSSPDYSEQAPSSGVRMSEPGQIAADVSHVSHDSHMPESNLTFKVYTVADLEQRRSDAPVSMRGSRVNLDLTSSRSSQQWQRVGTALKTFFAASVEWIKIKGQRPNPKLALRIPFDNLGDELQLAVESIDWKKLGVTTGIVVGATLTLLFAVLTAAELTDDLKPPGSASHLASADTSGVPAQSALDSRAVAPATNMAAMGVQPIPAPVVIAPSAPEATSIADIDSDTPAPTAKKPAAKKAAAKPKTTKLALRNAPF
jgi:hypothetical protein